MSARTEAMRSSTARRADRPEDYTRLGIDPSPIAAHEDGMRTDGGKGSYEWWYFDAHLDDGSTLVVVFYTKPPMEAARTLLARRMSLSNSTGPTEPTENGRLRPISTAFTPRRPDAT